MSPSSTSHPARWYLASVAVFMLPAGIQMVLLPCLLAIELQQPAARFGITQMLGQLPMLLFLLFGGWLADRVDLRRLLMALHVLAIPVPLLLAAALWRGSLSEALLIPLAVRDLFAGSAQDISAAYIAFGIGTLISIVALTRRGGVAGTGRALVSALLAGCAALGGLLLAPPQAAFYGCIFCWGLCGGVAMSMSRTILQERAPASHQSRVMAALSLTTVGGGPIGALITGLVVAAVGVRRATLMPVLGVAGITLAVLATHDNWRLRSRRG